MLNQIKEYLNRPLPAVESPKIKFIGALFFGVFIFLFLWIFQPFGISKYEDVALEICFGYGLVTFIIVLINLFLLPIVFKKFFNPESWTIKHDLLISLWSLFTIAAGNYFYDTYYLNEHSYSFGYYIVITTAVGIFPMAFGSFLFERRMKKEHDEIADKTNEIIKNRTKKLQNKDYTFKSDTKNEVIKLKANDLICIKSEGNYCEFYYNDSTLISKKLLRISLKKASEILKDEIEIVQCHRSYIANLKKVVRVDGNARNLSLHFDNMNFTIPISRSKEEIVTNAIRHI
jgi:hypothetical protein